MSIRLILVRHGETLASIDRRFAGAQDVDLTPHGHEQAEALARRLAATPVDAFYVSPLRRCRQTAVPVARALRMEPVPADDLRECHFGSWEGLSLTEVLERDAEMFQTWISGDEHSPPEGESWGQVWERVGGWWREAIRRHEGGTILAVTHGGPILCFLRSVLAAPYASMYQFEIDPCSVTVLQTRGEVVRVRLVNDTTHYRDMVSPAPGVRPLNA